MRKITFLLSILFIVFFTSCLDKGEVSPRLTGDENLPEHLKGLKIDKVGIGGGNDIYVATIPNHQTISLSYVEGKTTENVVVILPDNERTIFAKEILMENDSMILIRK